MAGLSTTKNWLRRKLKRESNAASSPAAAVREPSLILHRTPAISATEAAETLSTTPITQPLALETSSVSQLTPSSDLLAGDENDLWALAYVLVREREEELMKDYEKHLAALQDHPADAQNVFAAHNIESLVNKLLDTREKNKIQVSILGRNIKVREQIERLAKFLIWSDSIVKAAVSAQPYAALAWSGVSLFLPLLASGTNYNEAMVKGFNSIGDMQIFWKFCEETYFKAPHIQFYQNLKDPLIKLYSFIIEYQARVICHLSKAQISRAWQSVTGSEDCDKAIQSIKEQEDKCSRLTGKIYNDVIQEKMESQLKEIQGSRIVQEEILHTMKEDRQDEKERRLLSDLAKGSGDYERYKNINPERVPGTCEWFLADDRFCNWRDSRSGDLLWVSAGPGCGKSVLSKSLIDEGHLNSEAVITITSSTITVSERVTCYFFFKEEGEGKMDSAQALCAILHQLFTCKTTSHLITHALESHKNNNETLTEKISELWRILVECANSSPVQIVCVLDALDECKKERRRELIGMIQRLYSHNDATLAPSKLKFLITSRPYEDLEMSFQRFSSAAAYLHFDGDDKAGQIGQEINLVIDVKVNNITGDFSDEDRDKISQYLKRMENRTYLWLHLTFNIIEDNMSAYSRSTDMEEFLSKLPSEVSDAYEKILSRSRDEKKVEALLQIVLAAMRPLTLDEANYALALAVNKEQLLSHEELRRRLWPQSRFKTMLRNLCGLFISIHDTKLSFIHLTAREFLTHSERTGTWKGRLNMSKSHGVLSAACINYLLLLDKPLEADTKPQQLYPFFSYAANSWSLHFRSQDADSTEMHRSLARELCRTSTPQTQLWVPGFDKVIFDDRWWLGWPDLHLASFIGLAAVVSDIIVHDHTDVNETGIIGIPAIDLAIIEEHLEVIGTFLEPIHKTEVNESSMKLAVGNEDKAPEIMALLLDRRGNEIEITEDIMISAAENKQSGAATVAMLLKRRGGEIKITRELIKSLAQRGSSETMSLLLDKRGGEISITEDDIVAAVNNDKNMVALLLNRRGHEVKFTAAAFWTSLNRSAEILGLILDAANGVKITEDMLIYAAKGRPENMDVLLGKRGHEIKITEAVLKAGAENISHPSEVLALLLHRCGYETKITEDIVKAAAKNYTGGPKAIAVLLDKRGYEISLTQGIVEVIQRRDFYQDEILALFQPNNVKGAVIQ